MKTMQEIATGVVAQPVADTETIGIFDTLGRVLAQDLVSPASLGLATVQVVRRLGVAYLSTGDEILSLGETPRAGAVFNNNRYTVFGLLIRLGLVRDGWCRPTDWWFWQPPRATWPKAIR